MDKFIINSEKLSILSSYLSKTLLNCTKKFWLNLLKEFDFSEKIGKYLKQNKIKIWTKLNLPSFKTVNFIKSIIENDYNGYIDEYLKEEITIRFLNEPSEIILDLYHSLDSEECEMKENLVNNFFEKDNNNLNDPTFNCVRKELEKFFVPNKQVIEYVKNSIQKDKFLRSFDGEHRQLLFELFFSDYYSQIIFSLIKTKSDIPFDLFMYMTKLRFDREIHNEPIDYYIKSILWIHIYKDEFTLLFQNFELIKDIFPNIFNEIKEKINSRNIVYTVSPQHPKHKELINKPFLLILDSFFLCLVEKVETLNTSKILELIDTLADVVHNSDIYNYKLKLESKYFNKFKTFLNIIKSLKDKNNNIEDITLYIKNFKNERIALFQNRIDKALEEMNKQIDLIKTIILNCEEKATIIMNLIMSRYQEINQINYREQLCDIVLQDNNLLKISNQLLINILGKFSFTPYSLNQTNDDINNPFLNSVINNQYYPILNKINEKSNVKILGENLKYLFKFKIFQFYEEEKENYGNNDEKREIEFICEYSYEYFKKAYNILYDILYSKKDIPLINIKKLYCISYCNYFLEKFSFLVSKKSYNYMLDIIIDFLIEKNSIKNSFKLFILSEFKNKYILDKKEFLNINKWTKEYYLEGLFNEIDYNILENNTINQNVEIQYPLYYELISITLVEKNYIKDIINSDKDSQKKYPVLYSFLNANFEKMGYLQSFRKINDFVNHMIEQYSYKISRDEAKQIKINDELKRNIPTSLFKNFLETYNNCELYKISNRYICRELPPIKLSEENCLSYFLIDNGDYSGMYLAAIYENLILIQNQFLNSIIENIDKNNNKMNLKKFEYFKEKINKKTSIQKANEYNILSFDISTENYSSLNELILFYSYKDSFNNENGIKFNLKEIEEQLEYFLLMKKKFNDNINFVVYQYEGFRNQNSCILPKFLNKYPKKYLNENEKKDLYRILFQFRNSYSYEDLTKILFSLQMMIKMLSEQPILDKNVIIKDTFNDFLISLSNNIYIKDLFKEPFTISQIIHIYEYFEYLCFDKILNNILYHHKKTIEEEKKEKIEKFFVNNFNMSINKLEISKAIHRFISRYLSGIRMDDEIDADFEVFKFLEYREDCWEPDIFINSEFSKVMEKLQKLDIKVCELLNFFKIIGGYEIINTYYTKEINEEFKVKEKNDKVKEYVIKKKKKGKKVIY